MALKGYSGQNTFWENWVLGGSYIDPMGKVANWKQEGNHMIISRERGLIFINRRNKDESKNNTHINYIDCDTTFLDFLSIFR